MKKRNIIGLICIGIIILMIIGSLFYSKNDKNTQENNSVTFLADKTNDCKGNKIYAKMSNYQIISYCLDNIKITDSNTKDLVDYLMNNAISNLKRAKFNHDIVEDYYVPAMDFNKVELLKDEIINRILKYKK